MDPRKAVPVTAATRIQRWCLLLGTCSYQIEFLGTKQHAICDGLSRLPQPQARAEKPHEVEMFDTCVVETRPVTDQGPVSRKSRKLFGPEKPFEKLRPAYSVKLVFSYVVKGIKQK